MTSENENVPTDPMADPDLMDNPPSEPDAVEAATRMNDADGPQPGVGDEPQTAPQEGAIPDPPQ